jgi:hypothetical protein
MKVVKIILLILLVVLVAIQFIRPEKTSTTEITQDDITKLMNVPANVQSILKRSCYDCHSNQTTWPWYSHIAPASFLVTHDVNEGREEMNFSEWGKMSVSKREERLSTICEVITDNEMPLGKYTILHSDAKLSDEEKKILCDWADANSTDEDAGSDESEEDADKKADEDKKENSGKNR